MHRARELIENAKGRRRGGEEGKSARGESAAGKKKPCVPRASANQHGSIRRLIYAPLRIPQPSPPPSPSAPTSHNLRHVAIACCMTQRLTSRSSFITTDCISIGYFLHLEISRESFPYLHLGLLPRAALPFFNIGVAVDRFRRSGETFSRVATRCVSAFRPSAEASIGLERARE